MSNTQDKQGQPRNLNDVQFAAVIDAIVRGTFNVRATYTEKVGSNCFSYEQRTMDYAFDGCASVIAASSSLVNFMRDVEQIVAEYVELQRHDAGLRKANKEFSDEHRRLNLCLAEARERAVDQEGKIADFERRHANQSTSIGNYQAAIRAHESNVAHLKGSLQIIAKKKGDAEEIIDDLRAERTNLLNRIESQRKTIIDFQQKQHSFNVEKMNNVALCNANEQYARELAAAHAETESVRRVLGEWKDSNAQLTSDLAAARAGAESLQHSFKLADRALSARNDEIAGLTKKLAAKEEERVSDVKTLKGAFDRVNSENKSLRENVLLSIVGASQVRSEREQKQVVVRLVVNHDGSVTVQTDGPLSIDGNVECKGSNAA